MDEPCLDELINDGFEFVPCNGSWDRLPMHRGPTALRDMAKLIASNRRALFVQEFAIAELREQVRALKERIDGKSEAVDTVLGRVA